MRESWELLRLRSETIDRGGIMPPFFYMAFYISRQAVNDPENACNSQKQKLPPI